MGCARSPLYQYRANEIMSGAEEYDRLRTGPGSYGWLPAGLRARGQKRDLGGLYPWQRRALRWIRERQPVSWDRDGFSGALDPANPYW